MVSLMPALRANVSFRTSIPYDRRLHPVGEEVARVLLSGVDGAVGSTGRLEDWRDSGFELQYVLDGTPVHIAMSYVPDQPFDFYAQVASHVGPLRRLFGRDDRVEIERLIGALHDALGASPSFSEIAWHAAWYDAATMTPAP
jgi:hypothetical protein